MRADLRSLDDFVRIDCRVVMVATFTPDHEHTNSHTSAPTKGGDYGDQTGGGGGGGGGVEGLQQSVYCAIIHAGTQRCCRHAVVHWSQTPDKAANSLADTRNSIRALS